MNFRVGDYVTRSSHHNDLIFRIEKIEGDRAILRSFRLRLMADAPLDDLVMLKRKNAHHLKKELLLESVEHVRRQQKHFILNTRQFRQNNHNCYTEYRVKVLHLDGDKDYLDLSLTNYRNLNIDVQGFFISERGQPEVVSKYIREYQPDILVITGHDGEYQGKAYHTSNYFVKAVERAREIIPDLDRLVIFAGACQSDYEKLIASGANFASSPANKLIHFLDPILVVEKIVYTSIREVLKVKDVVNATITGDGGIGGIETRGKLRLRYP